MSNTVNVDFVTRVVEVEANENEIQSLAANAAILAAQRAEAIADLSTNGLEQQVVHNTMYKVNKPLTDLGAPYNGAQGQILRSKGNSRTEWVDNGTPTDAQVTEVMTEWLNEHPEATTTVEDGSLTRAKFTAALDYGTGIVCQNVNQMRTDASLEIGHTVFVKGYYLANDGGGGFYNIRAEQAGDVDDGGSIIILDNGNVAELITDKLNICQWGAKCNGVDDDAPYLQKCLDLLVSKGGTLSVTSDILLKTDVTINHNSADSDFVYVVGEGEKCSITVTDGAKIKGYARQSAGGVVFENINFSGTGTRSQTLFDGNTLIRIFFNKCFFKNFNYVFYGTDILQTIYFEQCYGRELNYWINVNNQVYDVRLSECSQEASAHCIGVRSSNGIVVTNSLIEGITGTAFSIYNGILVLTQNYFETNKLPMVNVESPNGYSVNFSDNYLALAEGSVIQIHSTINDRESMRICGNKNMLSSLHTQDLIARRYPSEIASIAGATIENNPGCTYEFSDIYPDNMVTSGNDTPTDYIVSLVSPLYKQIGRCHKHIQYTQTGVSIYYIDLDIWTNSDAKGLVMRGTSLYVFSVSSGVYSEVEK